MAALKVETVSAQRLGELGEGCQCAVCRDELAVGDEIQARSKRQHDSLLRCVHFGYLQSLVHWRRDGDRNGAESDENHREAFISRR